MNERIPSCEEIKRSIKLVDYLAGLNIQPQKITGSEYWYLSPLPDRNERTPSFKVDNTTDEWYDHGKGIGGTIIDFGILYFRCSIWQFQQKFSGKFPFHGLSSGTSFTPKEKTSREKKIKILGVRNIVSPALIRYLFSRRISMETATRFVIEADFELYEKKYTALGFRNDAGGYELRNEFFKGSASPKGITTVIKGYEEVSVFEGYFNFLTYHMMGQPGPPSDYLILNSLAFFDKNIELMLSYKQANLYLDRGLFGRQKTAEALKLNSVFTDRSTLYKGYEDLNDLWTGKKAVQQRGRTQ